MNNRIDNIVFFFKNDKLLKNEKKILFPILIIFLLINSCGFKIVNKSEIYKFDINEIITTGDDRINFKIKNKLI